MHLTGDVALRTCSHLIVTSLRVVHAAIPMGDGLIALHRALSGLQVAVQILGMHPPGGEIAGPQCELARLAVLAQGFFVDVQQVVLDIPFVDIDACGPRCEVEPCEQRALLLRMTLQDLRGLRFVGDIHRGA